MFACSYSEQAKILSDRFRDQLRTPLETGMHWVKHVAKNKGAPHLKSVAVDLPFYALYNLDVWAFILIIVSLTIYLSIQALQLVVNLLFTSRKKTKINLKNHKKKKSEPKG